MRYPQLVIFEWDGRLAALLRGAAEERGWALSEPTQPRACLSLLGRGGGAGVLVVRVGRDLDRELGLLDAASRGYPEASCVVVLEGEYARLAGLAWDLGAAFVHAPPMPRDALPEVIAGLLRGGQAGC